MHRTRTINRGDIERRVYRLWELHLVEKLQIFLVRVLTQVACDPDRVLVRRSWRIQVRVVELKEAIDRDNLGTVRRHRHRRVGGARVPNSDGDVDKFRKYNANVAKVEGGTHRLRAAKVRRRLHKLDMRVQVLRETVVRGADEDIAIDSVLPQMEFLHATSERGWSEVVPKREKEENPLCQASPQQGRWAR